MTKAKYNVSREFVAINAFLEKRKERKCVCEEVQIRGLRSIKSKTHAMQLSFLGGSHSCGIQVQF